MVEINCPTCRTNLKINLSAKSYEIIEKKCKCGGGDFFNGMVAQFAELNSAWAIDSLHAQYFVERVSLR